jgi:Leucine-rich repeat (LRR) protein
MTLAMRTFCLLFLTSAQITSTSIPSSELNSLQNLFTTTNGVEWQWRSIQIFGPKWDFTSNVNPCNTNGQYWQGIECNSSPAVCKLSSCSITSINLLSYALIGELPQDWTNFTQLETLDLSSNYLSGRIPSQLPLSLNVLDFGKNFLSGTLPSLLMLTKLRYLRLTNNFIYSSIDACLVNSLVSLYLESNLFDHSLPLLIGTLTKLRYLDIVSNFFTGPLPSSLGNLRNLTLVNIGNNFLTGSLPSSLGSLSVVDYLDLRFNSFTGPIPSSFGQLEDLTWLSLESNFLSSTLPPEFRSLTKLQIFDLSDNQLTHEIPEALTPLSLLRVLDLYGNYFTSFSSELLLSSTVELLILTHNFLSGSIPPIVNITNSALNYLELGHNLLIGTVPTMIKEMKVLLRLDLGDNHLTGTISFALSELPQILQVFLPNNDLTGTLTELLEPNLANQTTAGFMVTNIDLSGNLLSGTLPYQLFELSLLESLALTSNCFHGTIPETLCEVKELLVLSFDGLGSAYNCRERVKIPFTNVNYRNLITGTLPSCVWSMTRLRVMSVAGNGLSGTIGTLLNNSSLINLTLSHNHMDGTIPLALQHHHFNLLDLSYNKITGVVESFIPLTSPTTSNRSHLVLEVNRLSGVFPHIVNTSLYLNALTGNLFGCQSVPDCDVHSDSYICGSQLLDIAFLAFGLLLALIVLGVSVVVIVIWIIPSSPLSLQNSFRTLISYYQHSQVSLDRLSSADLCLSLQSLESMKKTLLSLMIISLLTTLPLLLLRAFLSEYSTHTNLNRWNWTTAYLTGQVPSVLLLFSWIATTSILILFVRKMKSLPSQPHPPSLLRDSFQHSSKQNWRSSAEIVMYLSLNILVMGALNLFYILSYSTHDLSSTDLFLIQLTVVSAKMFWSACCLPLLDFTKQSKRIKIVASVLNSLLSLVL